MSNPRIQELQRVFVSRLDTLGHLLDVGEAHLGAQHDLINARLAADMLPLGAQIAFACNQPRGFSQWCAGQPIENIDPAVPSLAAARAHPGEIDLVIVGSDRVLGRTGEVANKIGTYTKAVLAKRHRIPFYVAIPLSTIDWDLTDGMQIPIEERSPAEVLGAWGVDEAGERRRVQVANPSSVARNPGFDVTPPDLITGIITPVGILPPRQLWKNRERLV